MLNIFNRVQHLLRPNSVTTSRRNIAEHYDLGNEFYSLWLELLAKGARFGVVAEPVWSYRRHPGQMSATVGEDDARWRAEAIAEWRAVTA